MSHKTILVIDDDPVMCELTQEVLEDAGFAVAAMDIEEARAAFSDNPHRFDLILIDHFLSGTRGEEHATDFLCLRADIPIALYTGTDISLEEVRSKGICAVIEKPLTNSELTATIGQILRGAV
jgi:two-component system, OmpR family, response regulator CpxR